MNWVLLVSIAIQTLALAWSVKSLQRLRDWRLAFLSLMLGLMALRRWLAWFQPGTASMSQQWDEVPALLISVMSVLAVIFLGRLLDELKRAQESSDRANVELAERERRLRAIIETEPECVKLLKPNGTLLQMNPAGLRMIEADSLDQVSDRTLLDLVLPNYRPAFAELMNRVLQGGTESLEFEIQGLRGTRRWLETHAVPYRDAAGQITSTLGVTRDITERKRAEDSLRERKQQLRLFVEHSPAAIAMFDCDMRYLVVSRRWLSDFRLGAESIVGRSHYDLFPEIPERWKEIHRRCLTGAIEKCDEDPFLRADGTTDWVRWEIRPWQTAQGDVGGLIIFSELINERKQAQIALQESDERHRRLFDFSPDALFIVDEAGRLLDANQRAIDRYGYSRDELLQLSVHDLAAADLKEYSAARVQNALEQGVRFEWQHRRKDGSEFPVEVATQTLTLNGQRAILSCVRDISERKRAEARLVESERRFATLYRVTPVGTCITRLADGVFLDLNVAFAKITGHTREELLGRSSLEVNYWLDPEDRVKLVRALVEDGSVRNWEVDFRRKDGSLGHSLRSLERLTIDGEDCILTALNDITERKQMEQTVRDAERQLRRVLDTLPTMVGILAADGTVLDANRAAIAAFGVQMENVVGRPFADQYPWTTSPAVQTELRDALRRAATGETVRYDVELPTPSGQSLVADVWISPITDDAGRITHLIASGVDITDRKRAEEALRKSESMLELVLDSIPQGVFWKDRESVYLGANRVSRQAMGFNEPQSVVGLTDFDVPTFSREQAEFFIRKDREVMDSDRPQHRFTETMTLPDGTTIWLETNKMPMHDAAGKVSGILGTWENITDRKRAEVALRKSEERTAGIVASAMDAIISVDSRQRVVLFNAAAEKVFGLRAADVLGEPLDRFLPDSNRPHHHQHIEQFVETGVTTRAMGALGQIRGVRANGEQFPMEASISQIGTGTDKLFTVILRDITERQRTTDELAAGRERLEMMSRQLIATQETERRRLALELHDEIGQALTGIKLNLRKIRREDPLPTCDLLAEESIAVVDHTLQQVRSLALDLRPSMLDEIGLVAAVRWCLDRQSQRAGFAPQFVADSSVRGASPEIDTACFRIAQECLTNIARHAQARNVRVELRQGDQELELLVDDDGIGFDVPATRDRASHGTSLGILGMAERAQLLGGRFEIESVLSGGTTIRARFPITTMTNDQ